jgi:polyhydroxyalkanoate synthesis regulator phasin
VHQKTAKYCLKLRGKEINEFKCEDCKKNFTTKYNLSVHEKSCTKKKFDLKKKFDELQKRNKTLEIENKLQKRQIEDLKKQIEDLQNGLFRVAERPTTTNKIEHQIVQNLVQITPEHLEKSAENLTINHIEKGIDGYKKFLVEYPLKNGFITNDYSRRIITFVDENGNIIVDPNMTNLLQKVFKAIRSRNDDLIGKRIKEIVKYVDENPDLDPELLDLQWNKQRELLEKKELVSEVAKGTIVGLRQKIAETHQALIKELCKHGKRSKENSMEFDPEIK